MATYFYYRISQIEMAESADGLEALLGTEQLIIQSYCLEHNWYLSEIFEDTNIRWNEEFRARESARKLLKQLRPGDIVVVNSIERIFSSCHDTVDVVRLFRGVEAQLHVVELGGDITHLDFTANFVKLADVFSSLERRRSAERIKGVKQRQKRQGRYLGGSRPFGYMIHDNGRLIENPMEQRVLKKILVLKQRGKSLRAISEEVSTPIMPISFKTVQRLIQRHG